MNPRIVAIIPARGGSKRLQRKNIYPYFGYPLLRWAIAACQQSKHIDEIYVSTEDTEIKQVARQYGAKVIDRPFELAADHIWTQEVLQHAVKTLESEGQQIDIVARIQANSPQVEAAKIDEAITKLLEYKRWEIFSVDQKGLEDAAIHILKRDVVFQEAFSVYKGVVMTDYHDIHTLEDIEQLEDEKIDVIEQKSLNFLQNLEKKYSAQTWRRYLPEGWGRPNYSLWRWQEIIPLRKRWDAIINHSPELKALLYSPHAQNRTRDMAVLDVGGGFGMYWPILREFGFRTFVNVDLFDLRRPEDYYQAAQAYVKHFCPDCQTQVIMDDVRNLDNHQLIVPKFDVILSIAATSTKINSTGIPESLVNEIATRYGTPNSLVINLERIPQ